MVSRSSFKSFCMVALLVTESTQAVTPDTDSLTSTRLVQIVAVIAERGGPRVTHRVHVGCLTTHTAKSPLPTDPVPLEERSEESAPDEVCLASYRLAHQLPVNEAGDSHKSNHVPFDLDMLSVHSGRLGSSCVLDPVPCSSAPIHSLCRMTC
jgi:hypothetical protein